MSQSFDLVLKNGTVMTPWGRVEAGDGSLLMVIMVQTFGGQL